MVFNKRLKIVRLSHEGKSARMTWIESDKNVFLWTSFTKFYTKISKKIGFHKTPRGGWGGHLFMEIFHEKNIFSPNEGFPKYKNPLSKFLTVLLYQYDNTSIYLYQCGFELSWIQVFGSSQFCWVAFLILPLLPFRPIEPSHMCHPPILGILPPSPHPSTVTHLSTFWTPN